MSRASKSGGAQGSLPGVLLLGSAGFIGQHLATQLQRSERFGRIELAGRGVGLQPTHHHSLPGQVDAKLLKQCSRPDVVFWAIGGSSVGASLQNPELDREQSIPPLRDLLKQLEGPWHGTHLLFLSSAAVYGASASESSRTDSPLQPVSPYGEHKIASEKLIADRMSPAHFSIVRPFSVYGPGLRRQLLWDALIKLRSGNLNFSGSGQEIRDWVYVEDLARLLIDVGSNPTSFPRTINAGTGTGTTVKDVLAMLFRANNSGQLPTFIGDTRPGDPARLVACALEQQPILDYFRTPLLNGLKRYCEWFVRSSKP